VPVVEPPERKLLAADWNATNCPFAETLAFVLSASASTPLVVALTSWTWLVDMFHTNTFLRPLVDDEGKPVSKFVALDSNATIWPSDEIEGFTLSPLPTFPALAPLTRRICPVEAFVTKIWL
jgi:hypothetical protein